jgi:hypothetical protein
MRTAELFAGTKSFSKVAATLGHSTLTFECERCFDPDRVVDILSMPVSLVPYRLDILWASPPCQGFSVAAIGKNWNHDNTPKTASARLGMAFVRKTLRIIEERKPAWWFIENPRGKLRKLPFMQNLIRHTVTYCQYGDDRMKPTDIWTNATWWTPRPICKNGDQCHEAAPRGARTGTQGIKGDSDRSRIPHGLFDEIFAQMPVELRKAA